MVGALLGDAADGVGAVVEDVAVEAALGVGLVDEIGDEAAEGGVEEGGEGEELGRR